MYGKVVLENGGMLMFISYYYKDQRICNKAFYSYVYALGSVPDCSKTQKKECDKAVNTYPSTIQFATDQFQTPNMCDTAADT